MASQINRCSEDSFFKPPRVRVKRDAKGWPIGKRTERRAAENRELNKLPDLVKNFCEIRLPGCLKNKMLSWAHYRKARFLLTSKDWQTAARSCWNCHDALDHKMSHEEMRERVTDAIKRRKLPQ